jgi:undecaprenyl-diphosphatase
MTALWAIFYGVLQGLTEFLPISSSGHLALIPFFFELKDPGVIFDLMMHLGTAFAIVCYFHKELKELFKEAIHLLKTRKVTNGNIFFVNFTFATLVTVIFILLVKDFALNYGRNPLFIAFNLIFFGILLYLIDKKSQSGEDLTQNLSLKKSALIGFSQMLAIFPGVSRSGITITSARMMNLSREKASRFSFLLSLPIIFASVLYKLKGILKGEDVLGSFSYFHLSLGVAISFIVGILTIHFFLKLLNKVGFGVYAIYRALLGTIILILLYMN